MGKVRIGIIGIGNMGSTHAENLMAGRVPGARLTAICDLRPERLEWAQKALGEEVQRFAAPEDLLQAGVTDAVMICTPHYSHPSLAIQAFDHDQHVLIEKPAGVYTKQVREMNEAAALSGKTFCIMYNQRTNPLYQKARELIQTGELGRSGEPTGSSPPGIVLKAIMTAADGELPER